MKRKILTLLAGIAITLGTASAAWAHGQGAYSGPRVSFTFGTSWPGDAYVRHHRLWPYQVYGPVVHYSHRWNGFPPQVIYPPVYPAAIYPPVYAPQVIVRTPAPAPVYIEQSQPAMEQNATLEPGFWYFCAPSQAYYPYVRECGEPWQKVSPAPGAAAAR